jgi:hypothetical protein
LTRDKSSRLVVEALTRAATAGTGLPLHGSRTHPGLFPTTATGKQAAQRCCDDGYLQPGPESAAEGCVITDRGLAYLLDQASPRQVLEDFVRVLEDREAQLAQLIDLVGRTQSSLTALRINAANVLAHLNPPAAAPTNGDLKSTMQERRQALAEPQDLTDLVLAQLRRWAQAGSPDDCPLPWLFHRLAESVPGLTIGRFHDALRRVHEAGRLYLHPWTGPLPELPEPAYAVLVGHLIAYYASIRS